MPQQLIGKTRPLSVEIPYSDLGKGDLSRVVGTEYNVRFEERIITFISKCLNIVKVAFVKLHVSYLMSVFGFEFIRLKLLKLLFF